ncbi:MAG: hypothetical protein WAX89_04405, partial [Alphaproteobacteria bacterium]
MRRNYLQPANEDTPTHLNKMEVRPYKAERSHRKMWRNTRRYKTFTLRTFRTGDCHRQARPRWLKQR